MKAKEWLGRAYLLDKQIQSKQELIALWRELAFKSAPKLGSTGGSNEGVSRVEEYAVKIVEAQKEVEASVMALVDVKKEISAVISSISDPLLRILLEQRYLIGKEWDAIAYFMGYTEIHVRGWLHGQAISALQAKISELSDKVNTF